MTKWITTFIVIMDFVLSVCSNYEKGSAVYYESDCGIGTAAYYEVECGIGDAAYYEVECGIGDAAYYERSK